MSAKSTDSVRKQPTVFLATSVGVGIRYFFQTDIVPRLLDAGVKVVCLVPDPEGIAGELAAHVPGAVVEGLKLRSNDGGSGGSNGSRLGTVVSACADYLCMAGVSRTFNRAVYRDVQRYTDKRWRSTKLRPLLPVLKVSAGLMQRSRVARRLFENYLAARPAPARHADLFRTHQPDLVVVSSPGWFAGDDAMIREARARGVPSLALIVGWDHTHTKGLPKARPDRVRTWSEVQKRELAAGNDLDPRRIDVGGVAHFDFYQRPDFAMPREEYFARHQLDPSRRLVTFGCSFVGLSSNVGIVRLLAEAVGAQRFDFPTQLLIRLHPTHLKKAVGQYEEILKEVPAYEQMAREYPHVHVSYPIVTSQRTQNQTSRADTVELASLLRHSNVFVTLFSTMVLEAAVNNMPTVSVALEPPAEWRWKQTLSITQALDWPTHQRIIASGASTVVLSPEAVVPAVNAYLHRPDLHAEERRKFALQECTFVDDRSGERIARYIQRLAADGQAAARAPVPGVARTG